MSTSIAVQGSHPESHTLLDSQGSARAPGDTSAPPASSTAVINEDINKKGYFAKFWNFLSHKHSMIGLFVKKVDDETWPREARIWMFFFGVLLNLFILLKFLEYWSLIVRIIVVVTFCLPIKCIAKCTITKYGYEAFDPAARNSRARIIAGLWTALFLALSIWQIVETPTSEAKLATEDFFITWGTAQGVEVVQWWVVFQFVSVCCPCCLPCCLTREEGEDAKRKRGVKPGEPVPSALVSGSGTTASVTSSPTASVTVSGSVAA